MMESGVPGGESLFLPAVRNRRFAGILFAGWYGEREWTPARSRKLVRRYGCPSRHDDPLTLPPLASTQV